MIEPGVQLLQNGQSATITLVTPARAFGFRWVGLSRIDDTWSRETGKHHRDRKLDIVQPENVKAKLFAAVLASKR